MLVCTTVNPAFIVSREPNVIAYQSANFVISDAKKERCANVQRDTQSEQQTTLLRWASVENNSESILSTSSLVTSLRYCLDLVVLHVHLKTLVSMIMDLQ